MTPLSPDERRGLLQQFRRWVREERLPLTRQRADIAEVVLTSEGHLNVEAIANRLNERRTVAGVATIYRTLDLMVRAGVVRAHDFGEGYRRYEPMGRHETHAHLVCRQCGAVSEVGSDRMERMLPIIADEHGFRLDEHRLELYGTCANCVRRELEELGR